MIAMIVGAAIALLALAYVLYPVYVGAKPSGGGREARSCQKCGAATENDASFCSTCGAPLVGNS